MVAYGVFFFFFFKQKTAYEMLRSLVGSEMCIRDRNEVNQMSDEIFIQQKEIIKLNNELINLKNKINICLLYTSDAADE